jgi:GNAT superfamily N-acetyltransferase
MIRELLPPDTSLAFEAMRALRTAYADEQTFVRRVDEVCHSLAWGHYLYVDDLSTHPDARCRGHALLDWLLEEAKRLDCNQFHLNSASNWTEPTPTGSI